jgi:hypothetical protein
VPFAAGQAPRCQPGPVQINPWPGLVDGSREAQGPQAGRCFAEPNRGLVLPSARCMDAAPSSFYPNEVGIKNEEEVARKNEECPGCRAADQRVRRCSKAKAVRLLALEFASFRLEGGAHTGGAAYPPPTPPPPTPHPHPTPGAPGASNKRHDGVDSEAAHHALLPVAHHFVRRSSIWIAASSVLEWTKGQRAGARE